MRMARDAALGMTWLHDINMVHRDLKTANLLVLAMGDRNEGGGGRGGKRGESCKGAINVINQCYR
jgi:hypothetical protein